MIDPTFARSVQSRLGIAADGIWGRNTWRALFAHMGAAPSMAGALGVGANVHCITYSIITPLRIAHFMGQTAHESGGYRYMNEIWGPTPAQKRYEGRADLGNLQPGDGRRYAGRGILQLTGRANYRLAGERLGLDFEEHPELAAMPAISVMLAGDYWERRKLNPLCDADNIDAVTRAINGGLNGFAHRDQLTARAKKVLLP